MGKNLQILAEKKNYKILLNESPKLQEFEWILLKENGNALIEWLRIYRFLLKPMQDSSFNGSTTKL